MSEREFMLLALEEAHKAAALDEVPVGALLVQNGCILTRAHNLVEQNRDGCAHAELLCLREGMRLLQKKRLDDCTLYVTLEPCAMCAGAMINAHLGRLVFGAFDERCGCCSSALDLLNGAFYHTVMAVGGIEEEACAELLRAYFKQKR